MADRIVVIIMELVRLNYQKLVWNKNQECSPTGIPNILILTYNLEKYAGVTTTFRWLNCFPN